MADPNKDSVDDVEFDDNGKPIGQEQDDVDESGQQPRKKTETDTDEGQGQEPADPVIPVRRSAASEIIARQKRKIKKLESKDDEDVDEFTPPDGGDDDLTPDAQSAVAKEVQRQVQPLMNTLKTKVDEDELQELFVNEPDAKKFEKTIRSYMSHPNYDGVPPEVVYHHLAFGNAGQKQTKRKQAADLEAGQTGSGGTSHRPGTDDELDESGNPTPQELDNMSDEEFEKLQHEVQTGEFKPNS
jgi:hypothetical protein